MGFRVFSIVTILIQLTFCGKVLSSNSDQIPSTEEKQVDRNPKLFPYFLIQFPNEPCTGSDGSGGGVCVSAKECRQAGGTTVGVCAQGFGACCRYTKQCGKDGGDVQVRQNSTDIKSSSNSSSSCRFVLPKMRGICQVRLDFLEFEYGQGLPNGDCSPSKLEVRSGTYQTDLCGNLTGQHLYLNYENAEKIFINDPGSVNETDVYSIRVSYIRCDSRLSVPSHCTQYYSGASGEIRSLNWPNQQLNNQDYTICIANPQDTSSRRNGRMVSSNQKIHWSTCDAEDQGIEDLEPQEMFFISGKSEDAPVSDPSLCKTDFIQIFGGNRQCGNRFRNESTSSLPYLLHVRFDGRETTELGKGSSTAVNVSKPREGCESLNTQDTKCEDAVDLLSMDKNGMEEVTGIIDGGICQCISVPVGNRKRWNADVKNTGFCLAYKIVTE